MKYVPLATLLLTTPLLSQDAVRVENQRAIGVQDTSDPRYLGPPLQVPVLTFEKLPMLRVAGLSLNDFIDVPEVRRTESSEDLQYYAEKVRMQKAAGVGELEQSGVSYTVEKLRMLKAAGIGQVEQSDESYTAEKLRMQRAAGIGQVESAEQSFTAEKLPWQRAAGIGQVESAEQSFTAEKLPWQRAAGIGQVEQSDSSYTAEKLPMQRAIGFGEVEQSGVSYTVEKLRMLKAAGLSSTQSNSAEQLPLPWEREQSVELERKSNWTAQQLPMQRAIAVELYRNPESQSSGCKACPQPYPFESPAEKLARLRAERLGRDAAKEAIHNFADAIDVQLSPDKIHVQALANALQPIGFEEFADELDRTEPRLIIDYWFPRLWTRVLDHQLARSVDGLRATEGEPELFIDVRELLREREAVTRDRQTHQRLEELLNAAEVSGTNSQAFQEFQMEWTKVRMQRAIGLARQDRERTGSVSPTVRQRVTQLRGELGAIRASDH